MMVFLGYPMVLPLFHWSTSGKDMSPSLKQCSSRANVSGVWSEYEIADHKTPNFSNIVNFEILLSQTEAKLILLSS